MMQANSMHVEQLLVSSQRSSSLFIFLCVIISAIVSSCLTWAVAVLLHRRKVDDKSALGLMKHHTSSEPNTYEEPEKYRVTTPLNVNVEPRHATLTRSGTLKRDFSFRAKLDDSNY